MLEQAGVNCARIDGYAAGRWIVIDASDILVHIFHREEREFYNLERLWSDGTNTISYEELVARTQQEETGIAYGPAYCIQRTMKRSDASVCDALQIGR